MALRRKHNEPILDGPRWVGVGVPRAGTTWFTDLVVQHPEVELNAHPRKAGQKELDFFDRYLLEPFDEDEILRYRKLFAGQRYAGEFTPMYLRQPWVPALLREAAPEAIYLVLLRDPIERFVSDVRFTWSRRPENAKGSAAVSAGMYATQLEAWRDFPEDRLLVFTYEALRADPQRHVDRVWRALGLEPVPLQETDRPSATTVARDDEVSFDLDDGLRDYLLGLYRPEVERVRDEWGVDVSTWRHFT